MADYNIDFQAVERATFRGSFGAVFRTVPDSAFERGLARLCVLYEDIRIEILGASLPSSAVVALEASGSHYRHLYFMRRALLSLREFDSAIEQIRYSTEFQNLEAQARSESDAYYLRLWVPAWEFFRAQGTLLNRIRGDVGGHFGDDVARRAFAAIPNNVPVEVRIERDSGQQQRVLLPFATDLVARAAFAHLPPGNDSDRLNAMTDLLVGALRYAMDAVHFVLEAVLLPRMSGPNFEDQV